MGFLSHYDWNYGSYLKFIGQIGAKPEIWMANQAIN